ncbi:MAG: mechanosensitive ion channel family protein [Clostridiales bacterium]|nr:mechanosensitive ion channel family protein [Clostridiales bacterium]
MSKFKDGIKQDTENLKRKVKAIKPSRWIILSILLVVTVLSYVFYGYIFGETTDKNAWCHTPNTGVALLDQVCTYVPDVVKCIQSVTILLIIVTALSLIAYKIFGNTQRGTTIYSLIKSLLNWVTALVTIVLILAIFGVDTTALITGAGVVTLVIGLGMQSLIADIVAGLFIVFENSFNVGDIITVDGFRGEVVEIGIRTTKLKAAGNVKIFNNNAIQGVLNQSLEPSLVKTLIDVEYGEKLPEVERIIKQHVGDLKIAGAVDAVSYDGVASLGASGVTLQFTCHCNEPDIFAVSRELNAAVKNMFDENGIGIPFPQIVVHNGDKK